MERLVEWFVLDADARLMARGLATLREGPPSEWRCASTLCADVFAGGAPKHVLYRWAPGVFDGMEGLLMPLVDVGTLVCGDGIQIANVGDPVIKDYRQTVVTP